MIQAHDDDDDDEEERQPIYLLKQRCHSTSAAAETPTKSFV